MPSYVIHRGNVIDRIIISPSMPTNIAEGYVVSEVSTLVDLDVIKGTISSRPTLDYLKDLRKKIESTVLYNGVWYDADPESQIKFLGAFRVVALGMWPEAGIPWRSYDNSWHVLTVTDIQNLFQTIYQRQHDAFTAFAADEQLLAQGQPATNLSALGQP